MTPESYKSPNVNIKIVLDATHFATLHQYFMGLEAVLLALLHPEICEIPTYLYTRMPKST